MASGRPTLVIHPGALGDLLLAVPALRALRGTEPDRRLQVAAQPRIGALLVQLGLADEALAFDGLGLESLFVDDDEAPRVEAVERAGQVVCWFGARDAVFVRRLRQLAPGAVVASPAPDGEACVWQKLHASVAGTAEPDCTPVSPAEPLEAEGRAALAAEGWDTHSPLVMIHAGAGGLTKRWPAEGFARVAGALAARARIVLHQGPADREVVAHLAARLAVPALVLRDPPLPRLAGALRHVRAFLGNDSGVSHLAAAVGAPSVILFAAANVAWRPWCPSASALVVSTQAVEGPDVDAVLASTAKLLP